MVTSDAEWIKNCLKAVKEAIGRDEWSKEVESEQFSTKKIEHATSKNFSCI